MVLKEAPAVAAGIYTFAEKVQQPGVFNSRSFYNNLNFHYSWQAGNALFGDADARLTGQTNNVQTNNRSNNPWNTVCAVALGQVLIPEIDTNPGGLGGTPALRFTVAPYTGSSCGGFFSAVLKDYGAGVYGYVGPITSSPDSAAIHIGNVLYVQYKILMSSAYLSTAYESCAVQLLEGLSTSSAGSTTLLCSFNQFLAGHAGKSVIIYGQNNGNAGNWVQGVYTITAFNNSGSVTLNTSPTPSGAGTGNGYGAIGAGSGAAGAGFKQNIFYGNPPAGTHDVSVVIQDGLQRSLWQSYNHRVDDSVQNHNLTIGGGADFDLQPGRSCLYTDLPGRSAGCVSMTANVWHEVKARIELGTPGVENSIFDLWVDSVHVVHFDTMELPFQGSVANGLGQWDIGPYYTNKSPTQNHSTAYCHYKELIFSTQDIADGSPAVTALEIAAANLLPGTWAQFAVSGFDDALLNPTQPGQSGLSYGHQCCWDASRKVLKAWLGEHTACTDNTQACADQNQRGIEYDAATNTFSILTDSGTGKGNMGYGTFYHAYGHPAMDPDTGNFFVKMSYGPFYQWTEATRRWSQITNPSDAICRISGNYGTGCAYFPGVGLIAVNGNNGAGQQVALWNGSAWSSISGSWDFATASNIAIYNPILDAMLIGSGASGFGGELKIHRLERNLSHTALTDAPFELDASSDKSNIVCDPATGKFLVVHKVSGTKRLYEYDMDADSWTLLGAGYNPPTDLQCCFEDGSGGHMESAPISSYGVVMYINWIGSGAGQQKVYLYKHAEQ